MSELIQFIGNETFEEVKKLASSINLNVKETPELYMLSFSDNSDFTDKKVRQANGTIFEKNTNKLVHFSFEKCYNGFDTSNEDHFEKSKLSSDYTVEMFFEGSVIKIFYTSFNDKWNIGTSRQIEAEKNNWTSRKTFNILFEEAIQNSYDITYENFLKTLDKEYCHTFLLQHPDNKMVTNIGKAVVFHLNSVNLKTLFEIRPEEKNLTLDKTVEEIECDKKQNYMVYLKRDDDNTVIRIKVLTNNFLKMINLRGSYPDIGLTYMKNIKNYELKLDYISFFPSYTNKFMMIDRFIEKTTRNIHTMYIKKHIQKFSDIEIPENYIRTICQLHGQFKRTKQSIYYDDVYEKLINLEPKILAYVINYKH